MKILQILPYRFWGGPEIQTFQLTAQLAKDSTIHTELLLYTSGSTTTEDLRLVHEKAAHYHLKLTLRPSPSIFRFFSERKFIARYIKQERIDLAVGSGYIADLLLVKQKIRKIAVVHGWTGQNLKVRFYERLDRFAIYSFDMIACVSMAQQKQLQHMGLESRLLSNAIDLDSNLKNRVDRATVLKLIHVSEPAVLILSVGRLSYEKGHLFALKAFQKISYEKNNVHWVFIGEGPEEKKLSEFCKKSSLKNHVHFLGKQEQARRFFAAFDLFILPSYREGLPVVLLEAFAESVPVIATDVGGNSELIINQKTGLLVKSKDVNHMANQLTWAIANRADLAAFSSDAYTHLQENFSLAKQSEQWQEIIRYALSK